VVLARRHLGPAWAAVVAARKLMKGTALLAVSPRRGGAVFHGAIDGIRGRLGKTIAPEAALGAETDDIVRHGGERTVARVMRRLRGTAPAAVNVRRVGASRLATTAHPPPFLAAWHQCVVETIARCILRERLEVDLFIDDTLSGLEPPFAARRIGLQWEHTLVRPGGRDSEGHPLGRTPLPDGRGHYLARVARRAALERCDLVIDYSHANLANLQGVPALAELAARSIVISPLVHGADPSMGQRDLGVITLMHDLAQPRRARFVADAARAGLAVRNFRGVYEPDRLRRLYRRARVLVNLRQTDDHHTLEELRVLPALLCGVVVVSEDVPLRETIPYARHVTWAAADDLVEYARLADADHQRLHAQLFSDGQFDSLVASMRGEDDARLTRALIALAASDR
jgi:hypothetical protein